MNKILILLAVMILAACSDREELIRPAQPEPDPEPEPEPEPTPTGKSIVFAKGVPNLSGEQRLRIFSTYVVDAIRRGVPSLAIALSPKLSSLHHATTLWGYEIDNATGLLTRVWITDSDDMTTEPKHPVLHEYSVGVSGYNTTQLSGAPYGACYVATLLPVSGYDMF